MILIEFCGTPGCGKTTVCDEVEQELLGLGYSVKNLQKRKFPATYTDKIQVVIERFCFRHVPHNRKIKKALQVIKPYLAEDSLINWPDRILEVSYRIKKAEKAGVEVGLLDEGCLQFITSVFHGKTVTKDVQCLIDVLVKEVYKNRTLIFDCKIDELENYQRLVKRNKPDDRFLTGGKENSLFLLKQKRNNISIVLEMLNRTSKELIGHQAGFPAKEFVLEEIQRMLKK